MTPMNYLMKYLTVTEQAIHSYTRVPRRYRLGRVLWLWAWVVLLLFADTVVSQAKQTPPRPVPPRLVNDYTRLLSPGEMEALERKLVAYNDSTSTQIAIVIENSLEGDDVFDYSLRLAQSWGIGQDESDNGVLIYVALQDRKLYIHTGYGAERFLPDAMAKRIIENILKPTFREGQYYQGLDQATSVIMQLGAGEFTAEPRPEDESFPWITLLLLIALIIFFSYLGRMGRYHRHDDDDDGGYWRGGRYDMGPRGGWVMFPPSGGGGGWSGGGGGGFGGFGGGSFGGGGAGGSW